MALFPSAYPNIFVVVSLLSMVLIQLVYGQLPFNGSPPTIIVFGDSTADPGNNDYTSTWDKSNFWPYGIDFPDGKSTGRFTNGFLMTDIAATYMHGTKTTIGAFLDPNLSLQELMQGVSFASAGSGFDIETAQADGALTLDQQLANFNKYKTRIEAAIGAEATQKLISKAMYVISTSTNDFFDYWFGLTSRKQVLNTLNYQQFLLSQFKNFTQALLDHGARNLFLIGTPPVGHLPESISFYARTANTTNRQPVESLSAAAEQFNTMLKNEVQTMQASLVNHTISYADSYGPIHDMVTNPAKYGFKVVDRGCCGAGLQEYGLLCTLSALRYGICSNRSEYFFWDGVHPTQRGYECLFEALRPTIDTFIKTTLNN